MEICLLFLITSFSITLFSLAIVLAGFLNMSGSFSSASSSDMGYSSTFMSPTSKFFIFSVLNFSSLAFSLLSSFSYSLSLLLVFQSSSNTVNLLMQLETYSLLLLRRVSGESWILIASPSCLNRQSLYVFTMDKPKGGLSLSSLCDTIQCFMMCDLTL